MFQPKFTNDVVEAERALKEARSNKAATIAFAVSIPLAIWGAWASNWKYQPFNPDMWIVFKGIWFGHFLGTWEVVRRSAYEALDQAGS